MRKSATKHSDKTTQEMRTRKAGSKLIRGFYRAAHGTKETFAVSLKWYHHLFNTYRAVTPSRI